jgi:hypothetical protein
MAVENPTGGDAGASIEDRLEAYLSAEDAPGPQDQHDEAASTRAAPRDPAANAGNTEDDPAEGEPDFDGPQLTTSDLAKVFGLDESALDVDDTGAVLIKTKVDGREGTAKFADVLKSYQMQGHVDNQAREVAAQRQAIQQQAAEANNAVMQRLQHLDTVLNTASQELQREFHGIDWQTLRATDPGEYSARLADFNVRQQNLNGLAQQGAQQREFVQQQQQQDLYAHLNSEHAKLPTLIPEWRDQAVAQRERNEVWEYAAKAGYSNQELAQMSSSAHVAALRKAMLFDRLQGSKAAVEARVRAAPKLIRPGQAPNATREQNNVRSIKTNIRNSGGKTQDVAAYLLAAGKV